MKSNVSFVNTLSYKTESEEYYKVQLFDLKFVPQKFIYADLKAVII